MKAPSLEQILILILFILLPLLNLLFQRAKRRSEAKHPEDESRPEIAQRAHAISPHPPEPRIFRDRLHRLQAPTVSTPLPRRRSVKRLTLGKRREIRRGIILMAVLGPCRASDPPGEPARTRLIQSSLRHLTLKRTLGNRQG